MGLTGFDLVLLGFTRYYWILLGFRKILTSFTGFYWVSLGLTEFQKDPIRFGGVCLPDGGDPSLVWNFGNAL